uniref:Uncharacterized protein n=1 Tax=Ditylum brightwellii TaxID=49249 RepID=A0A7S4W0F8_9STRA
MVSLEPSRCTRIHLNHCLVFWALSNELISSALREYLYPNLCHFLSQSWVVVVKFFGCVCKANNNSVDSPHDHVHHYMSNEEANNETNTVVKNQQIIKKGRFSHLVL